MNTEAVYFAPEEEYQRYVVGRFQKADFAAKMLQSFGEISRDSPQISKFYPVGNWTVIPCPTELMSRGDFFNLSGWLSQEGEEAFAFAIHPQTSYYAVNDKQNRFGDTMLVHFDNGNLLQWSLPMGLTNDNAYTPIKGASNLPGSCKELLQLIQAQELIAHFIEV